MPDRASERERDDQTATPSRTSRGPPASRKKSLSERDPARAGRAPATPSRSTGRPGNAPPGGRRRRPACCGGSIILPHPLDRNHRQRPSQLCSSLPTHHHHQGGHEPVKKGKRPQAAPGARRATRCRRRGPSRRPGCAHLPPRPTRLRPGRAERPTFAHLEHGGLPPPPCTRPFV